jgi:uncharacterized protein involved in exopolysaccharide biosynthesis
MNHHTESLPLSTVQAFRTDSTLSDYAAMAVRYKWLIAGLALAFAGIAAAWSFTAKPLYQANKRGQTRSSGNEGLPSTTVPSTSKLTSN